MDAAFALEKAEGVRPGDAQGHAFDARLVAGQKVHFLHRVFAARGPAGVQTQQHFGPVLGFRAARAGVDFQNGVLAVFLGREQHDQLGLVQQGGQFLLLLLQGFQGFLILVFRGQNQPFLHVVPAGLEAGQAAHLVFQASFFL